MKRFGSVYFFTLEYVILIWNDTTNIQIYSFQVGESNRLDWHLGVNILIKNGRKMIDPGTRPEAHTEKKIEESPGEAM